MRIKSKHLGKIVDLSLKPEWGPGIISKMDLRFAYIIFKNAEDPAPKRYFLDPNPLTLSANQEEPDLVKRARVKNRKIKAAPSTPALIPNPEALAAAQYEPAPVKKTKSKKTAAPLAAL
ncbi:MAG TPA: hypothetical protein VMU88_00780 [bacterium]|nr:hypothetical protein [bacterium]